MIQIHVPASVIAIKDVIDNNPISREPIKKLAPQIHVGRNQLQVAFKKLTGKTIKRYRMEKRMEAAATMLTDSDASIKDVAIRCGHAGSISNFSKLFKVINKMSPEEWARKSAESNNIREMRSDFKKCI